MMTTMMMMKEGRKSGDILAEIVIHLNSHHICYMFWNAASPILLVANLYSAPFLHRNPPPTTPIVPFFPVLFPDILAVILFFNLISTSAVCCLFD